VEGEAGEKLRVSSTRPGADPAAAAGSRSRPRDDCERHRQPTHGRTGRARAQHCHFPKPLVSRPESDRNACTTNSIGHLAGHVSPVMTQHRPDVRCDAPMNHGEDAASGVRRVPPLKVAGFMLNVSGMHSERATPTVAATARQASQCDPGACPRSQCRAYSAGRRRLWLRRNVPTTQVSAAKYEAALSACLRGEMLSR
jgi:hypothetical protein